MKRHITIRHMRFQVALNDSFWVEYSVLDRSVPNLGFIIDRSREQVLSSKLVGGI